MRTRRSYSITEEEHELAKRALSGLEHLLVGEAQKANPEATLDQYMEREDIEATKDVRWLLSGGNDWVSEERAVRVVASLSRFYDVLKEQSDPDFWRSFGSSLGSGEALDGLAEMRRRQCERIVQLSIALQGTPVVVEEDELRWLSRKGQQDE